MNIIETKNLCYSYEEGKPALDHINISFPKGKCTAVLGGNGAGKSTLFLNLNGVLTPDSGEVLLDGEKVSYSKKDLLEMRRKIGIVFQDPNDQLFSASVRKDISFGAVNLGLPKEEVERRVEEAIRDTGIAELADRPTHALSFGQKKRAAIAGVLVMEPELIILDEPTAGLDPEGVSEILQLLQKIQREKGVTIVIATHEMDIVPLFCDYAYVINRGRVALSGTPKELFQEPQKLRENHLQLPRIAQLMEVLSQEDKLPIDQTAATVSEGREAVKKLLRKD